MEILIEFGDVSKKSGKMLRTFFRDEKFFEKKYHIFFRIPMSIGNCPNFRKIILIKSLEQDKHAKTLE